MSIVVDQRKRNANQAKPNIASQSNQQSQQNSKKGNKPQNPTQNQSNAAKPATSTPSSTPIPPPVAQAEEPHVALKGFNAEEIDALLKSGYDEKALIYKAEQPPWGQKRAMSNGKDFWLELRKQVATLQKGESTNKGG